MSNTKTEAQRMADRLLAETSKFGTPSIQRGLVNGAIQELRRLDAIEQRYNEMMANPCPEWDNKAYMQAIANLRAKLAEQEAAFKQEAAHVLSFVQARDREKPFNDADMFGEMVSIRLTGLLGLAEMVRPGCREAAHAKFLEEVAAIRARSNT